MKVKGFGKKYFTLASIQAYSTNSTLQNISIAFKNHLDKKLKLSKEKEEDEPPKELELLLSCSSIVNKPCHCNCFFKRKSALAVRLFKYIPRCPFYCTFFAFRRTGVHPPLISF
ncbi:hypothetical protein CRU87_06315 [Aliarcobacter trophiarum LMG 25534]|uniref:Uncharacterized protein n=1 Tax=Aliarcobacter trophiarum LMG 25534 TaxID=1032241 RepID=A0AAD0VN36_9BACT|nr:hypothetical protein [Aliarcobacter trophiarum]AXK49455.1 hypothetical protein ATR_1627 [Aliarcobacter trophiarum LMG 25534]RXI27922.1 hypothetical protein CRU89_03810 [Aliarcobacter trophiarum]RXJ91300.1 hypothetical protein CRU87_06315 [Aliarcobacter trophiarum LMG 25534]